MTPESVLRLDPRKMEADLAAARDAQGKPLTAQAMRDLLQERIRQEVTHRIQIKDAGPDYVAKYKALWNDPNLKEGDSKVPDSAAKMPRAAFNLAMSFRSMRSGASD
jgi:hypothetical protein